LENVDRIVHCAGCINMGAGWDEAYAGNVQTAQNLYEEALNYGIKRIVHFSSVAVYGKQKKEFLKESDPLLAEDTYGKTKKLGEEAGLKLYENAGLPVTIIRPCFVYGPGDFATLYPWVISAIMIGEYRKKKVILDWKRPWHFVSIKNVLEATQCLLDRGKDGEAYNIADPDTILFSELWRMCIEPLPYPETRFGIFPIALSNDFFLSIFLRFTSMRRGEEGKMSRLIDKTLEEIRERYNVKAPKPMIVEAVGRADKYKKKYALCYDTSKITALGYEPVVKRTREGIKETIQWYIDNGWIPDYRKVQG